MKNKNSGRAWPYSIGAAIILVFGFCVATVVVTGSANIQESDDYMTKYQDADANINKLIKAKIAFDKKYNINYITDGIDSNNPVLKYKITDKDNNIVNNAEIIVATSRPETKEFDQKLKNPTIENGIYSFKDAKFPKVGIWNIIAKVTIGDYYRFYNVKADTRIKEAFEF